MVTKRVACRRCISKPTDAVNICEAVLVSGAVISRAPVCKAMSVCAVVSVLAGVDDDKMGCLQALHAVEAFLTVASALPINMK
jgi:hypothetical protein